MSDLTRRTFLQSTGFGLAPIALNMLAEPHASAEDPGAPTSPLSSRQPHFAPRAKRVIYLHMIGAPSQLDLFDYKPTLQKYHNQPCPEELVKGKEFAFIGGQLSLAASPFQFSRHGDSGQQMSELLPHLASVSDELAIIRSLHTDEINHAPAQMFLRTGFGRGNRPSFGSWVTYGLGTENEDLPAYVVLLSGPKGGAGTGLWGSGFLPSVYQGTQFRSSGDPVLFLSNPKGHTPEDRRRVLDATSELNRHRFETVGDPEIRTRIEQYEMAFRMQTSVPVLMDVADETQATLDMYGVERGKPSFAANCLQARRLIERGIRLVELYDADWDHHSAIEKRLGAKCRQVDQPMAALVRDLKQRGLLDDTLVVWGSEFGRTPLQQGASNKNAKTKPGRDHHKDAFTVWMAGGGVKGGVSCGATDDFGFNIVDRPVHVHDLNATVLHLLGLDHERLTYKYQGRQFRLTDVDGHIVTELLA